MQVIGAVPVIRMTCVISKVGEQKHCKYYTFGKRGMCVYLDCDQPGFAWCNCHQLQSDYFADRIKAAV